MFTITSEQYDKLKEIWLSYSQIKWIYNLFNSKENTNTQEIKSEIKPEIKQKDLVWSTNITNCISKDKVENLEPILTEAEILENIRKKYAVWTKLRIYYNQEWIEIEPKTLPEWTYFPEIMDKTDKPTWYGNSITQNTIFKRMKAVRNVEEYIPETKENTGYNPEKDPFLNPHFVPYDQYGWRVANDSMYGKLQVRPGEETIDRMWNKIDIPPHELIFGTRTDIDLFETYANNPENLAPELYVNLCFTYECYLRWIVSAKVREYALWKCREQYYKEHPGEFSDDMVVAEEEITTVD